MGTEADVFCLPENNWSREYDLTCNILRASRKLLPSLPNPHNHYFIQTKTAREGNRYPIFVASEQGLDASV